MEGPANPSRRDRTERHCPLFSEGKKDAGRRCGNTYDPLTTNQLIGADPWLSRMIRPTPR